MAVDYQSLDWALVYDQYNHGRHELELGCYSSLLKGTPGPTLEIACGTGMMFFSLLNRGLDMYGIDISTQMLDVLYKKAQNMHLADIRDRVTCQSMTDFSLATFFEVAIIPARSFLHLTSQEEQIACLRNIRKHLTEGGKLILNFFNPKLELLLKFAVCTEDFHDFASLESGNRPERVDLLYNQCNDIPAQVQHLKWKFRYSDREVIHEMRVKWIYREEFQLLLRLAGFTEWKLYGGFDLSDYSANSPEMIWIATK